MRYALVVLCAASGARARDGEARPLDLSPPDQFLVDKEVELAAIVRVRGTEIRSVILPDGNPLSLILAECEVEEILSGSRAWTAGTTQKVLQHDYNGLIFDRIAPPVIGGRRYVLWGLRTPSEGDLPAIAPWTAHLQGFLPIRGRGDGEFVFWNGKSYSVGAIRQAVAAGRRLPLDQIVDPVTRLRVAEERLKRATPGDEKAFIQGLLVNVLDPDGQARRVERALEGGASTDPFGMGQGEGQPHSLWYRSLGLLRDFGKDPKRRASVVAALAPVAQTARPAIRMAAALALVDLGSDAGRDALLPGFESESGPVSGDPADPMLFPGFYPHDGSSTTACAHALARLGDRRGLRHRRADVRLATAEALEGEKDPELRQVLQDLCAGLQPQVDKLGADGELKKARLPGDRTHRYPEAWIRTQRLLARTGDDEALRRLVEAHIAEAGTYPKEDTPVPEGPAVSWSGGPSPAEAGRGADASAGGVLPSRSSSLATRGGPAPRSPSSERPSRDPRARSRQRPLRPGRRSRRSRGSSPIPTRTAAPKASPPRVVTRSRRSTTRSSTRP
jgi:hypothetical protein